MSGIISASVISSRSPSRNSTRQVVHLTYLSQVCMISTPPSSSITRTSRLHCSTPKVPTPSTSNSDYAHVAYTVDAHDGTAASLKKRGITVTPGPKTISADGQDYKDRLHRGTGRLQVKLVERGTMKVGDLIP
jgi:hypothetical protein